MKSWLTGAVIGAVIGASMVAILFVHRPRLHEFSGEEGAGSFEADSSPVTDQELQLYIEVYTTMQGDHDLTIEQVLAQHGVALSDFRKIERRIQQDEGLVKRVRDALLGHAKVHAQSLAAPAEKPPTDDRAQ